MFPQMRTTLLAGIVALCGLVHADIPGLFVVQEARIQNPFPPRMKPDGFGGSSMSWIGDFDGNGVEDFITGVPNSFSDSGSLLIHLLNEDGSLKAAPLVISPRDPMIAPSLFTAIRQQIGGTVLVLQAFSTTQNDAIVLTTSKAANKIWTLRLRRSGSAVSVVDTACIDSVRSTVLSGLRTSRVGEALELLDTISGTNERVIAIGVPNSMKPTGSGVFGRVVLAAINPATFVWRKLGMIPESWESDVIAKDMRAGGDFGRSLARLGEVGGNPVLGILASGDASIGKLHVVEVRSEDGGVVAARSTFLHAERDTLLYPFSISSSDYDHDGIRDLLVGLPSQDGPNRVAGMGAFAVLKFGSSFVPNAIQRFGKGMNGFVGAEGLAENTSMGFVSLAGDFDRDGQTDALIGVYGDGAFQGSILPLRMKARPWVLRAPDTTNLVTEPVSVKLSEYIRGNALKWTISEVDPPPTGSLTSCGIIQSADGAMLRCIPFATNGISKWKVVATDSGNIPVTDRFSEEIIFVVRVKDQNLPPRHAAVPLPAKIQLLEDQGDSAVLVFSRYFEDPDGRPLRFEMTPLNGSVSPLLNYYLSANYDTLHLQPIPLRFGSCSLQVAAKDDASAILLDTIVVEVKHVNHAPVAVDDAFRIIESTPSRFGIRGNDRDVDVGDRLVLSVDIPPTHGRAQMDGDTLVYVPDSFFLGKDSLRYRLSDSLTSAFAWVRITIANTADPLRVHAAMRDTSVNENTDSIVVRIDSLFFSGAMRFAVSINEPTHSCQGLARVSLDPSRKSFTVFPLAHAFGSCRISILESQTGMISDTMRLELKPILTPYLFPEDTVALRMASGSQLRMVLDTIDRDKDTLMYSALSIPSWARLVPYGLVLEPGAEEGKILIEVRKKPLPGIVFLEPSDTLVVYARFETTSVRRRAIGNNGAGYSFEGRGVVLIQGGAKSFQVQILTLDGRSLARGSGSEGEQVRIEVPSGSRMLILRLTEGGRTFQIPLMRHQ